MELQRSQTTLIHLTKESRKSDGDPFGRHRRSLLAMSFAFICFVAAGGTLSGASLLGGSVTIAYPWVLFVAALLAFLYVRLQYRLARGERLRLFQLELAAELFAHKAIRDAGGDKLGEDSALRFGLLSKPVLSLVPPREYARSVGGGPVTLPRMLVWRALIVATHRAAWKRPSFVEVIVPELLFWLATAAASFYVAWHAYHWPWVRDLLYPDRSIFSRF